MITLVRLETSRILLRPWKDDDYAPYAAMNLNHDVTRYFGRTLNSKESDKQADYFRVDLESRGWGFWALERKIDGAFMGYTGLMETKSDLPIPPCVETGWRLGREYWGKGYATEAAAVSLEFGFGELNLPAVFAYAALGNVLSRAVMERLGMELTPITFEHPRLPENHTHRLHCLYRLDQKNWSGMFFSC